jgi:hypothetical protein
MKITEANNRLIAEFMGMKYHFHASYITFSNEKDEHIFDHTLQYSSSWKWLMPVLDKIEKLPYGRCLEGFNTAITNTWSYITNVDETAEEVTFQSMTGLGVTKIEAVYDLVVQFITWYNDNRDKIKHL